MPGRLALRPRTVLNKVLFLLVAVALAPGCQLIDEYLDNHKPAPSGPPRLELVTEGLTQPVAMAEAPDGSGRLFVVDQIGLIRVVTPDGKLQEAPFLDIRDKIVTLTPQYDERGLLGLAFHPDYRNNGRFFVYYSAPLRAGGPGGWNCTSRVAEFKVSSNPLLADKGSEKLILAVDKPQANHNGGTLALGPTDHYLYISVGDGGGRDDEAMGHVPDWYEPNAGGNGQDLESNLLGNLLRINVDGGNPYSIPADNPLLYKDGLDEIYAFGFRNPSTFSFDMEAGHRLFVGDVGQELWEEIDIVTKGGNYGWNVKEGTHCFDAINPTVPPADCPTTDPEGNPLIDPVIEIKNAKQPGGLGFAIVGGYVYRGKALPGLKGQYLFGTWSLTRGTPDGLVFVATPKSSGLWDYQEVTFENTPSGRLKHYLLNFGQDSKGEVYLLTSDSSGPAGTTGKVYKLAGSPKK
ncbi:MAG: PQQ-dependent sugar dehydrogenase [Ferruginibacter sp.]|nr:PQQ-dependent sugar dehydrogenase [Cytophagales bacterium]